MKCTKCKQETKMFGNGNLGELTPCLQGSIYLCPACWTEMIRVSNSLTDWEEHMQFIIGKPAKR